MITQLTVPPRDDTQRRRAPVPGHDAGRSSANVDRLIAGALRGNAGAAPPNWDEDSLELFDFLATVDEKTTRAFLVVDGTPVAIANVTNFMIQALVPTPDDAAPRSSRHHRRRSYNHRQMDMNIDYHPEDPTHRALRAAGSSGAVVTLRLADVNPNGLVAQIWEADYVIHSCSLRLDHGFCTLEDGPDHRLEAAFDMEVVGEYRLIASGAQ